MRTACSPGDSISQLSTDDIDILQSIFSAIRNVVYRMRGVVGNASGLDFFIFPVGQESGRAFQDNNNFFPFARGVFADRLARFQDDEA